MIINRMHHPKINITLKSPIKCHLKYLPDLVMMTQQIFPQELDTRKSLNLLDSSTQKDAKLHLKDPLLTRQRLRILLQDQILVEWQNPKQLSKRDNSKDIKDKMKDKRDISAT